MFTIVTGSHETFDVNTVLRPSHADFYQGSLKQVGSSDRVGHLVYERGPKPDGGRGHVG